MRVFIGKIKEGPKNIEPVHYKYWLFLEMSDRVLPRARLIILYFSYIDIFQMPLINQDSFTISELMHLWVRENVFFKISDGFIKFILYFIFSSLQILGLYYMSRTADQDFLSKVEKANRGLHCIAERF